MINSKQFNTEKIRKTRLKMKRRKETSSRFLKEEARER